MTPDPDDYNGGAFFEPPEPSESLSQSVAPEALSGGSAPDEHVPLASAEPVGDPFADNSQTPGDSQALNKFSTPGNYQTPNGPRIPNDARVPWGWLDIGLLALLAIGATFIFGIAIVLVLAAFGVSPSHLQKSVSAEGMVAVVAQILADLSVLVFLAVQARVRFRMPFWETLGWRRLDTGEIPRGLAYAALVFGGFLLAVLVTLLDSAFPAKEALPIQALLADRRTAILFMLTAVLVAPVVEETVFRGYLYPVCVRSFGISWGILATGTMFGLLHSVQLWGGWWQIGFLVLVGIVLTVTRAITGTVAASYVVHASYNALPVIAYVVATHGFRQVPPLH